MSPIWILLRFYFWKVITSRDFFCVCIPPCLLLCFYFAFVPLLMGQPFFRSLLTRMFSCPIRIICGYLLFVSSVFAFVYVFFPRTHICIVSSFLCPFLATMFGHFLVRFLLFAFPAYFSQRFPRLIRFVCLSCDHGWIRSGSVTVR